ncbi:radical SAM protein [Candidatus Fermentibacteria bacterium]|nr:radical SAM protein [Candidatus Fermentibacteria bacterium]
MLVAIISPYAQLTSIGVRSIGAYLKAHGHRTRLIFLPDVISTRDKGSDYAQPYPEGVDEQLVDLCTDADLVAFSLSTNYFFKVAELSRTVRERLSVPVVWGGVHPTISPEECLEYADYVCVGEGEDSILELADRLEKGENPKDVGNMLNLVDGKVVRNPLKPLIIDLDSLPQLDYSLQDHHVLLGDRIVPLDESLMRTFWTACSYFDQPDEVIYETMWTRGCPYHCSFCINGYLLGLYGEERFFRRRSVDHLMTELTSIRERFPWFNNIVFTDDCFTANPVEQLQHFAQRYREEIGVPFFCLFTDTYMVDERIEPLKKAGMQIVEVGLQSADDRTNRLYRRPHFSPERILRRARRFTELTEGEVPIIYDIILDNPYDDVDALLKTLWLAERLPPPKKLHLFSFTFYPGIELHRKALADGTIEDPRVHYTKDNHHREARYVNFLFTLLNKGVPRWMLKILAFKPWVRLMESPPFRFLFGLLKPLYWRMLRADRIRWAEQNFAGMLDEGSPRRTESSADVESKADTPA